MAYSLAGKLKKVDKDEVNTKAESRRGILQSEKLYDSMGIDCCNLITAARDNGIEVFENRNLRKGIISVLGNLIRVATWSLGGDSDSKPDQRYIDMAEGVRISRQNMAIEYVERAAQLVVMGEGLPADSVQAKKVSHIIARLIATADETSKLTDSEGTSIKVKLNRFTTELRKNGFGSLAKKIDEVRNSATGIDSIIYKNDEELLKDIEELRGLNGEPYEGKPVFFPVNDSGISLADMLYIGVANFGDHANRIEYRQSNSVYEIVFAMVSEEAKKQGYKFENTVDFTKMLKSDLGLRTIIQTSVANTLRNDKGPSGLSYLEILDKAKQLADDKTVIPANRKEGIRITAEDWKYFLFKDTLEKMKLIATSPDSFSRILTAEASDDPDVSLKSYALSLVGKILANKELDADSVPVTPLFEYENAIFKDGKPILKDTIVNYVKALVEIGFKGIYVTIMVASSDSWKNMSSAVQDIIRLEFAKAREALNNDPATAHLELKEFFGTGSGPQRNGNMVHAPIRTLQGQEPALLSPEAIATETQRYRTFRLRQILLPETLQESRKLSLREAWLNCGNTLCLPEESPELNARIEEASSQRIGNYLPKYHSVSGSLLYFTSPTKTVKDHSLGARPANRILIEGVNFESQSGETPVWHNASEEARTIGYWLALQYMGVGHSNLYSDIADYAGELARDEQPGATGSFSGIGKAKEFAELYLSSPSIQSRINAASTALYLTDFGTAWNYLNNIAPDSGADISRKTIEGETVISAFGKDYKLADYISSAETRKELVGKFVALKSADASILMNVFHGLAIDEWEAQKSARAIAETFGLALRNRRPDFTDKDAISVLRDIVNQIEPTRTEELKNQLESDKVARNIVLNPKEHDGETIALAEAILKFSGEGRSPVLMNPEIALADRQVARAA